MVVLGTTASFQSKTKKEALQQETPTTTVVPEIAWIAFLNTISAVFPARNSAVSGSSSTYFTIAVKINKRKRNSVNS